MQNWLEAEVKMPHVRPDHHADTAADFREQFWISTSLTLPILVPSPMLQTLVRPAERDGKTFLQRPLPAKVSVHTLGA